MKAFKTLALAAALCTTLTAVPALPDVLICTAAEEPETVIEGDLVYRLVKLPGTQEYSAQVVGIVPEYLIEESYSTNPEIRDIVEFGICGYDVTSIAPKAFQGTMIESIIIPDSVIDIGESAFKDCESLTEVELSAKLPKINAHVFEGCKKLSSIHIPDKVQSIGLGAFRGCTSLESVDGGTGITSVESGYEDDIKAFYGTPWLESTLKSEGFAALGKVLFAGSDEITELDIPEGIETIGECAFADCEQLTHITFPRSVKTIELFAFDKCKNLVIEEIPETVYEIKACAFCYCESFTNIKVGAQIVEEEAFGMCKNLSDITFTQGNCSFGDAVVYNDAVFDPWDGSTQTPLFYGTIHGLKGSSAEEYAKDFQLAFAYISQLSDDAGDLNEDGAVTSADAQLALIEYTNTKVAGKSSTLSFAQRKKADIDRDGYVTAADAQLILRYYVQKNVAGLNPTWEDLLYGAPDFVEEEPPVTTVTTAASASTTTTTTTSAIATDGTPQTTAPATSATTAAATSAAAASTATAASTTTAATTTAA